jgi:hypothetical protein
VAANLCPTHLLDHLFVCIDVSIAASVLPIGSCLSTLPPAYKICQFIFIKKGYAIFLPCIGG